ncbi:S4 domain-containing protein, partial [Burkholderia pseudomallei]
MDLESILFTQGVGSRRQCRALVEAGHVAVGGATSADAHASFDT